MNAFHLSVRQTTVHLRHRGRGVLALAALVISCLAHPCAIAQGRISELADGLSETLEENIAKANAGDVRQQFVLGLRYDYGFNAPKDPDLAITWYKKAAEAGDADAQNSLGSIAQSSKNYTEAFGWYQMAAERELPKGTNNLAYLYDLGLGVTQDRKHAMELYEKAANWGDIEAMWNLGMSYRDGSVGPPDYMNACIWVIRAFTHSTRRDRVIASSASPILNDLGRKLSNEQVGSCRAQGEHWTAPGHIPAVKSDTPGPQAAPVSVPPG